MHRANCDRLYYGAENHAIALTNQFMTSHLKRQANCPKKAAVGPTAQRWDWNNQKNESSLFFASVKVL